MDKSGRGVKVQKSFLLAGQPDTPFVVVRHIHNITPFQILIVSEIVLVKVPLEGSRVVQAGGQRAHPKPVGSVHEHGRRVLVRQ